MLNEHNVLVKSFRMAKEKLHQSQDSNVKLKLIGKRSGDARTYNLPTVNEVAALVVGDFDESLGERDILVETRTGKLQRISELNPAYFGLQYPLLFPYGEDGYREDIPLGNANSVTSRGRQRVSIRQFLAFRLQQRDNLNSCMLKTKRLFQQFVVDGYTMIESGRLQYVRIHQKQLRCEMYKGLSDAILRGENDPCTQGKRIILPPSFTGGARFMIQNYQDAMAICRWAGYPDLFITFTCNPKWPEITRFLRVHNLKPEDRPDIVSRIFKVKLDGLIKDFRRKKVFGNVKAVVYTIEFQKRGLPHAHILLFLENDSKYPTMNDVDKIISAEIPDFHSDPSYYEAVKELMMHGPCGPGVKSSPCMVNGKCTKHFPKPWCSETKVDDDGYPVYRRRKNGRTVKKNNIVLDNRFVVPHNRYLLMKYKAHMNVEWCNQSRSIKYLFKYINKGRDRVTAGFYSTTNEEGTNNPIDEIKMYYDCRYISPCEASWRIFGFEIQYKNPAVERLSFHFPDEQPVIFSDHDELDRILDRKTVKDSMFLAWFEANKKYAEARGLTYVEFPQKFVWKQKTREWVPRKIAFSIGRIYYVPPGSGEIYYLRCLLNHIRGATCFNDLKTIKGVLYRTYREACYALGLLSDDKEYVDGITEASYWAFAFLLRILFAILLVSESLSRPDDVWKKCWKFLADDIQHKQRLLYQHPGYYILGHALGIPSAFASCLPQHNRGLESVFHDREVCLKKYKMVKAIESEQYRRKIGVHTTTHQSMIKLKYNTVIF
ncbi:unnamed protein product [Cuscuta epithymum]|uniref:Helitron helicase-like domain-containing protein n=1 Tax=Cuscuta epithymum TaxID=186058 RepID=A0AAV0EZS3_9ASTE|nr:unnamed protein product [Cuscuta epithymum]